MSKEQWELEAHRAEQVAAFLGNETIKAVFQGLELSYYQAWREAQDPAEREKLHAQASAFDDLREAFKRVVATGERATHELDRLKRATA